MDLKTYSQKSCVSGSRSTVCVGPNSEFFFYFRKYALLLCSCKGCISFQMGSISVGLVTLFFISNRASQGWPRTMMAIKLNTCEHKEAKSLMLSAGLILGCGILAFFQDCTQILTQCETVRHANFVNRMSETRAYL